MPVGKSIFNEDPGEKRGYLTEKFRLFHLRDEKGTDVGPHYHDFHKLILLVSGRGSYMIEGRSYELRPGDVVLVGSHMIHRPDFESGMLYERFIFYISPELVSGLSSPDTDLEPLFSGSFGHVLRPDEAGFERLVRLAAESEAVIRERDFGFDLQSASRLTLILAELGLAARQASRAILAPVAPRDKRIPEILQYLDSHLTEDLSVEALAARFFLSRYHLMRLFKENTGCTLHGYISDKRLLLSREKMRLGQSATDACYASGFKDYSSFARAYRKLFGVSPRG